MTFLTGDRPTEEGRGLENDGGGGRNERLGVEIEMALKHVMLRKERERESTRMEQARGGRVLREGL